MPIRSRHFSALDKQMMDAESPLLIIVISKRAKAMLHSPLTDIAALLGASAFR
jgi:hypothetical protein